MIWNKILRVSAFSVLLGSLGCLPEVEYPEEPAVEFLSFDVGPTGDAVLSFNVTDGDGDLGLDPNDIEPPFCPSCEHYYNFKCEYDELRDGIWTHIQLNPNEGQVPFYYRVPRAVPSGTNAAINGVVEVDMNTWSLQSDFDTLRFRITIEDRSLNVSNEDTTFFIIK